MELIVLKIVSLAIKLYRLLTDKEYFTTSVIFLLLGIPYIIYYLVFDNFKDALKIYDVFTDSIYESIDSLIFSLLFVVVFQIILPLILFIIGSLSFLALVMCPFNFIMGIIDLIDAPSE